MRAPEGLGSNTRYPALTLIPRASQIEGVKGYYDHEDIPGSNRWGPVDPHDEEVFASETVTCIGQQIGVIVAETEAAARAAARAVKIEYEDLPGALFSCEEAIEANNFYEVCSCSHSTSSNTRLLLPPVAVSNRSHSCEPSVQRIRTVF